MRFHYDWEFKENGVTIEPISLGMVADNGKELYMIYRPAVRAFDEREYFGQFDTTDLWLKDNVFNHLPWRDVEDFGYEAKEEMGRAVYNFICDNTPYSEIPELWGYFASYDHVCLSQLFGRMIDLPAPMPMFTNELMTIGRTATGFRAKPPRPNSLPEHHSLMDAKYQKLIFEEWSK